MPDTSESFKYDVAISFLSADSDTARAIADLLSPLKVFFFPRNQEEVAGTDGMETFRSTFRCHSRIQVVLYRKGWGETPWTRIEETAIKDRCLDAGWEGLFFVAVDSATKPKWVPDTKVYLDLSLYSMGELIGAIKLRAQELGAALRRETSIERARKALARADFEKETRELFSRETGVKLVRDQTAAICDRLESEFNDTVDHQMDARIIRVAPFNLHWSTKHAGLKAVLNCAVNVVDKDAAFEVELFKHSTVLPGENRRYVWPGLPKRHRLDRYKPHRNMAMGICWEVRQGTLVSSNALAEKILDDYWAVYEESVTKPLRFDW